VVRERRVLVAAMVVLAGAHAGDDHGDGDDAAPHGARRRELEIIGVVISVHVLGMFAFAPWPDSWPTASVGPGARWRRHAAPRRADAGARPPGGHLVAGVRRLFLLGLGWSFSTVAGSTLITDHAPSTPRTTSRVSPDLVMGVAARGARRLSGLIVDAWGFNVLR
jgi:hypothetical protein